jgi:hypothetical protein
MYEKQLIIALMKQKLHDLEQCNFDGIEFFSFSPFISLRQHRLSFFLSAIASALDDAFV